MSTIGITEKLQWFDAALLKPPSQLSICLPDFLPDAWILCDSRSPRRRDMKLNSQTYLSIVMKLRLQLEGCPSLKYRDKFFCSLTGDDDPHLWDKGG